MTRSLRSRRILAVALNLLLLPLLLLSYVALTTRSERFDDPAAVPSRPVAIVFGAGVRRDGRPTPMLADRIQAAVGLYQDGRVGKLLMTGDNGSVDYDEVTAMRRYAIERGVPAADIVLDYAGFRTYDSCYRARAIFGVREAIVVTQRFHLPRAVYTCRALGVDAVGLGTADWGIYSSRLMRRYTAREAIATLNALLEVHLVHPRPRFLGPYEGLGYHAGPLGTRPSPTGPNDHQLLVERHQALA